ncbi:MAG: CHAT domain-containing protein [Leptolyngbyaceae cyanobacterium]
MKKILILASNPRKDLNLDREIRDLKAAISRSNSRDQFEVVDELAVQVENLQDHLLRHRPHIVHFCGHGSGEQGLVFEGESGGERWVRTDALSNLFRLFEQDVKCVLLNACYSEEQADAIVSHIDYVIGMNQTIQDNAAIAFAKGFYRALGYDRPIEDAYEFGCNAIQLEITGSSKVRSTATEAERKAEVVDAIQKIAIPEHLKPILKKKVNLTPSLPTSTLTQERRTEIQLEVAQSLAKDSASDQYRAKVREFLADRTLSKFEEIRLEQLREKLGLSVTEANQIVAQEQQPIQAARAEYKEMLLRLIEEGYYPFDDTTQRELQQLTQELELTEPEVTTIAHPILEAAEADYQQRLAQERHQQQIAEQQQRQRVQELERQREQQRQREIEQQLQEAERRRQEEAKRKPPLTPFDFQTAMVNISTRVIEKPGWLGKKTETETTVNITRQPGRAQAFVENLGNGVALEMVQIPGGSFLMGAPEGRKSIG